MTGKYLKQKTVVYLNVVFSLVSLLLFLISPYNYSHYYVLLLVSLFLIQTFPFVWSISDGNFVNFYTLFLTSYFFINFFYPVVVYPINPELLSVFTIPFNHDYITKGTALALLASSCFITGASLNYRKRDSKLIISKKYTGGKKSILLVLALFFLFLSVVGTEFLKGSFTEATTASRYILMLLITMMLLASILYFKRVKYNSKLTKVLFWLANLVYIFIFLSIGDRGPALYQIVLIFGLFTVYVKPIPKRYLAIIGIAGILLMEIIGFGRVSNTDADGTIITRGIERVTNSNLLVLTTSFIVNSRNLYVGVEYVENEGINYGKTYLTYILSPIPFAQRTFIAVTGENIQGSAGFFTELGFGNDPPYGLGTNLVADVYIAFGLPGVLLLFFLLGCLVEHLRNRLKKGGLHIDIIYYGLVMYSVYLPRATMFTPLNIIVWAIVLSYLFRRVNLVVPYIKSYYRKFEY
jgi:oligosaccharide repeat unit polymerase